ncbi:MAG: hypothetical protein E7168_02055 [Firmicutes bacterium]|nr:hypothetical protein [Bacillota bacterium]
MEKEELLLDKFQHIFIMLHHAIMMDDVNRVKHFLSNDMFRKYDSFLQNLTVNNERQMYDELNVKSSRILQVETTDTKKIVTVEMISRYMDYIVDKETMIYKRGNNKRRIEKKNILIFEKKLNSNDIDTFSCQSCGSSLDINYTGVCSYCREVTSLEDHDYILVTLETCI